MSELQNAVDAVNITSTNAAETVFYWYHELGKFGVAINATTIKAALDKVNMLPGVGGFPDDYVNPNGAQSFLLYFRFDLYAYQWAAQLGYETCKWNISLAYTVFDNAVRAFGGPILCIQSDGNGWGVDYGPRYYDECAETFDMYLTFYLMGVSGALSQAEGWWNWVNANLWDTTGYASGGFYKYALNWTAFECEAGGMDQLALETLLLRPYHRERGQHLHGHGDQTAKQRLEQPGVAQLHRGARVGSRRRLCYRAGEA